MKNEVTDQDRNNKLSLSSFTDTICKSSNPGFDIVYKPHSIGKKEWEGMLIYSLLNEKYTYLFNANFDVVKKD
jgi:hypothetical protein